MLKVLHKSSFAIMMLLSAVMGSFIGEALNANAFLSSDLGKTHPKPNAVDIGFAQSMQVHHNQAIQMAMMVKNSSSTEIQNLAHAIMITQTHETGIMKGWLSAWHQPTMVTGPEMRWVEQASGVTDLDDLLYQAQCKAAEGKMAGLATQEQLNKLKTLKGKEQERLFLELMIEHHKAALPMARFARNNGNSPLVKNLAKSMIADQSREIEWMQHNKNY